MERLAINVDAPRGVLWLARLLACGLLALASTAQPAALTGIQDYRYLVNGLPSPEREFPALVHEFEGLAFTDDGSLWASIAADPLGTRRDFWRLDVRDNVVHQVIADTRFEPTARFANPVALAGAGSRLIVGENFAALRASGLAINDVLWAFTPGVSSPELPDWTFSLPATECDEVEGAATAGGKLYVSCQTDGTIIEIDPQSGQIGKKFPLDAQLLGLEALDDGRLLVGDYSNHRLLVFDLALQQVTDSIDLASLFTGPDSDYFRLVGEEYLVQVVPSEGFRRVPDPDGLAYRDGTIYMAFDGDLRIFAIALRVPEPTTVVLLGLALLCLAWMFRRR
ncbi:PEP-CTERM sorting domain-containing protein [Accumulibacter sp.]|uniref:YncE family protein n=1 Tax=Accumulibacter sp. TaxID=2053492 RepID=UPI002629DDC5|nr:PEP-CTERM sorting domain-containing protein [Accumulibacter sp.]